MPGFPIRTPWDHSLVDSSPRPIAASHVLHRLLVPRHSPFALDNLTTKMLASTVQFSTNDQPTTHKPHTSTTTVDGMRDQAMPGRPPAPTRRARQVSERNNQRLFFQDPTGCLTSFLSRTNRNRSHHPRVAVLGAAGRCRGKTCQCLRHLSTPTRHPQAAGSMPPFGGWCSLERR